MTDYYPLSLPTIGDFAEAAFDYRMTISSDKIFYKALINAYSSLNEAWSMEQLDPYYTMSNIEVALFTLNLAKIITLEEHNEYHARCDQEPRMLVIKSLYELCWQKLGYVLLYENTTHSSICVPTKVS